MRAPRRIPKSLLVVLIAALMAVPAIALLSPASGTSTSGSVGPSVLASTWTTSALDHAATKTFPYTELGRTVPGAVSNGPLSSTESVPILVTFNFANSSRLANLLGNLQDPHSPQYHHYLTATEFDTEFGLSPATYESALQYFQSLGATQVHSYADRVSLSFDASPSVAASIFHTSLASYGLHGQGFYAPTAAPQLPDPLASIVAGVDGLSSYSALVNHPLHTAPQIRSGGVPAGSSPIPPISAYPTPVQSGGFQFEFASDFQVAYDQRSLFAEDGYPTDMVAATILGSGTYEGNPITTPWGNLVTGENVGPFVPHDIYDFYNQTLPAGEPHATIAGVPLNGAPAPGPLASFDNTSANVENTLDLEMLGSTAPGAHLYNVYGPSLSNTYLDDAFAFILNPNATYAALDNVSVISNSWGGTDAFDAGWNSSLASAAARGITVLASSGDSASNPNGDGGSFDPPGQTTLFPASMAYDTYGVVAVGGTTVTLDPTSLQMTSNVVWNQTAAWDSPNPAAGSTGGVSAIFPEPDWQNDSSANAVIQGGGRGVPDIAAIANNTIMTLTIGGIEYNASNASLGRFFINVAGTSIASPLTAGMVVDADHVMGQFGSGWLGFLDPTLYPLANAQYTPANSVVTPSTGYIATGAYNSTLPTLPFFDVTVGRNFADSALVGYDLVTGWGTMDAYNFTMYFVSYLPSNTPGDLASVLANFNLTGLQVTSTSPYYNASIQQNFFVANALGAPIYWVQNVIYINGSPGAWQMNFSGWVVFPYWGIYPSATIYEYNFPVTGQVLSTPLDFSIETTLQNTTIFDGQSVQFSFGIPDATPLTLPLPGGSYILGNLWNNYSWEGNEFSNNPLENGAAGSLSPQFGLVGGPSGGLGTFTGTTGGNLQLMFQRFGSSNWVPGATQTYGETNDQTGESASGISWTLTTAANLSKGTPANWTLGVSSGSTTQGVLMYDSARFVSTTPVTVTVTGLPPYTYWSFFLNTGQGYDTDYGSIVLHLANGTYYWNTLPPSDYTLPADHGELVVSGTAIQLTLAFTVVTYNVTIFAIALPANYVWWANVTQDFRGVITDYVYETNASSLTFALGNSSLVVGFAAQENWTGVPHQTDLTITGGAVSYDEAFSPPPKFMTSFVVQGLPKGTDWVLNVSGQPTGTNTTGASVNLSLKNGSYSYVAHTPLVGYFATSGVFGVDGYAHEIFVSFLPAVYEVSFTESGLPTGSLWGLQIQGGPYLSSNGVQLNWTAGNGTYNYTVLSEPAGWSAGVFTHGQLVVDGGPSAVAVQFTQVTYAITFQISGLPLGTSWGLSLDGAATNSTTASSLSYSLPNGTYSFSVSLPNDWISTPSSGSFSVTGEGGTFQLVASEKAATSSSSGPLGLGAWGYALLALAVLVILVVAGVLLWTRRPPEPSSATDAPESGPADGPGPDGR